MGTQAIRSIMFKNAFDERRSVYKSFVDGFSTAHDAVQGHVVELHEFKDEFYDSLDAKFRELIEQEIDRWEKVEAYFVQMCESYSCDPVVYELGQMVYVDDYVFSDEAYEF